MPILKPHETQNKRGVAVVVRENPMVRIVTPNGRFIAQAGQIMDESGRDIDPVPDWIHEEMAKISPEMQKQVGYEPKKSK